MGPLDFREFSLWLNLGLFGGAGVVVWLAGNRLAGQADVIADRTGLGKAFIGLVLLGVATSLPEIATTVTGSILGNAKLVAGNLFGGVALQIAILSIVDLIAVRGALTYFTPQPVLLFQGVMLLLLLAVALAGAAVGDPLSLAGLGLTPVLLVAGYGVMVYLSRPSDEAMPRWKATNQPRMKKEWERHESPDEDLSNGRLYTYAGIAALLILAAGWVLAQTGDALSEQTNLGASFVGVALVAASTSLPELSTALAAVRQGNHQMAVSNILGTNCLEVALFFLADAFYRGGPILAATDRSAIFAAAIGMVVTCIYLIGLLERRNQTVARMGYDSFGVLISYALGVVGVYFLG